MTGNRTNALTTLLVFVHEQECLDDETWAQVRFLSRHDCRSGGCSAAYGAYVAGRVAECSVDPGVIDALIDDFEGRLDELITTALAATA